MPLSCDALFVHSRRSFRPPFTNVRLHSAIGYITLKDKIKGRTEAIFAKRYRNLDEAWERRKAQRQVLRTVA